MATAMIEERWLSCQLDKGMFSDEVAVTYPSGGKWRKSVFVPIKAVAGNLGAPGKVRVEIVHRKNKLFAVLPSSRRDIVEVMPKDVTD